MRTSTILAHCPKEIQALLRSAPTEARNDHRVMRTTIFEAVIGRAGLASRPMMSSQDASMEVDAILQGKRKGTLECHVC
mgnify:FL=1